MDACRVLLLAIVQGIAEFLPISSSGHLAVLGSLFGFDPEENLTLGILLHAGTLLAIVVFYFAELLKFFRPERFRLAAMVVLGSAPAGLVGGVLKKTGLAEALFGNLLIPGVCFIVTGLLLQFGAERKSGAGAVAATPLERISWRQALLIGLVQAVAILPGISRSGSTIAAGLRCRLDRKDAAEFSFLLAIPAIGGSAFLELLALLGKGGGNTGEISALILLSGFAAAAIVGYISLRLLIRMLSRGRLACFSYYLYAVGAAVIVWQLAVLVR